MIEKIELYRTHGANPDKNGVRFSFG